MQIHVETGQWSGEAAFITTDKQKRRKKKKSRRRFKFRNFTRVKNYEPSDQRQRKHDSLIYLNHVSVLIHLTFINKTVTWVAVSSRFSARENFTELLSSNKSILRVHIRFYWVIYAHMRWRDATINTFRSSQLSLPPNNSFWYLPESKLWEMNAKQSVLHFFFGENKKGIFRLRSALVAPWILTTKHVLSLRILFSFLATDGFVLFATCVCKLATNRLLFFSSHCCFCGNFCDLFVANTANCFSAYVLKHVSVWFWQIYTGTFFFRVLGTLAWKLQVICRFLVWKLDQDKTECKERPLKIVILNWKTVENLNIMKSFKINFSKTV